MNHVQTQMPQLEAFIDESIKRSARLGHVPTRFIQMRERYGTVVSINKLVPHSEEQSGFKWARDNNLLNWTLEAGALKFPDLFPSITIGYAKARLAGFFKEC